MDLSKLPRLSETSKEQPTPPVSTDPAQLGQPSIPIARVHEPRPSEPIGTAGDAWISIAVGVIILVISPRLFQYLISPSTFSTKWTFNDPNGNPLTYPQTVFFWGDIVLYLFAATLIIEGLILVFARKTLTIGIGFGLTTLATAANAIYLVAMMSKGYGFQLYSAIAVAFGVYIAMYQWNLLKAFTASTRS